MPVTRRGFLTPTAAAGVMPPFDDLTSSDRAGGQLLEESFESGTRPRSC
jgi:hypothetical protein